MWVSKACRVCVGCRRLVRCVVVEGLKGVWVSKACRMGVEGF